jgi:hypothetical protein
MPTLRINVLEGRPLLDIASYARKGPDRRDRLSPAEVAHISRTVRRVPEVMVKVLSRGSNDASAVAKHIGYIGRYGELAMETDDGEQLQGRDTGRKLLEEWDLDLDERRHTSDLAPGIGRLPPKLVHKLMLSMPAGTPPEAVLAAARTFLREEFGLKHRYAFVLHTDEPHPHVHAVVKAVSEQGVRLNIRKATLRTWRQEFARHLRAQGVEANATEQAVRGENRFTKRDGIFRAGRRGASTHLRDRLDSVIAELARGRTLPEPSKETMIRTRHDVMQGWRAVRDRLMAEDSSELSLAVRDFANGMYPVRTEREWLAVQIIERGRHPPAHERGRER